MDNNTHTSTEFYAQPYDTSARGFYFNSAAEYRTKASIARNTFGEKVEEFELQFIDGDSLDGELFAALGINQNNLSAFFRVCATWGDNEKIVVIIAVGEAGYNFDLDNDSPDDFEIDLYEMYSLKDLAQQFVEEGLFGDIPEKIANYLDYDAIGCDLGMDYTETTVNGDRYIYRCG